MKKYIPNRETRKQVERFLLSGGTSACVEYISFFVLMIWNVQATPSQAISFSCGLITSFVLNKVWVFGARNKKVDSREISLFVALALFNLIITTTMMHLLVSLAPALFVKLMLMGCVAVWNYLIFKRFIFK